MLSQAHQERLRCQYGIDSDSTAIREMIEAGLLRSVTREEAAALLGLNPGDACLESGGIYLEYPGTGGAAYNIRLDVPYHGRDGRERKYMRPAGQGNRLFVPPGIGLGKVTELWLTEGELKALAASLRGQAVVALAGVWNWRSNSDTDPLAAAKELEGEKAPDRAALLADFREEWTKGKNFVLWYDSDIHPGHEAYPAFQRLAEQLYRLGAASVKVMSVLPTKPDGKTGLDDYLAARQKAGKDGLAELRAMAAEAEEYLPTGDGARPFAEAVAADRDAPTPRCVRAVAAVLQAEGDLAAEEMAEKIDRRRARALLKDAKRLVRARREEEKKTAEARAKRDLEKILAEAKQAAELEKLREAVQAVRIQEKKKAAEIQEEVFSFILSVLSALGKFYVDDRQHTYWFSSREKVLYRLDSTEFNRMLTNATGVSDAETLGSALRKLLDAYAAEQGEKAEVQQICYFDRENVTLYLHQYDGRVLRITGSRVEPVDNGTDGALFLAKPEWVPWDFEDLSDPAKQTEAARLFNRFALSANFDPSSPLSPHPARLVLLTWRLSGFFRVIMPTRPITLFLGETESGKSMLARLWRRLLYGGKADLGKQHDDEDDAMTYLTNDPWAVLDNVDESVEWLPDLLAVVSTGGELPKRKLYTTNELERYAFDTWLTLTARTPRFKRDDVATRLLPLRLAPLARKEPEGRLLAEVADPENRSLALSYLALLLNQVVAAFRRDGLPGGDEDFRLTDYAAFLRSFLRATMRICREAADQKADEIIATLQELQAEFLAEDDPLLEILVEAIDAGAVPEGQSLKTQELYAALVGFCKAKEYSLPVHHPVWLARRLVEMGQAAAKVKGIAIFSAVDPYTKTNTFTFKRRNP